MGQKASSPQPDPETRSLEQFFNEQGTLDALKITLMIWKHRDNPDFVNAFTEALTKFSDEQTVFDEIEFYLPQLAHMIIHLEIDWPIQALERFTLVVCQSSLHMALQLNWILLAAMEDYQPEDAAGNWNPNSNPTFYSRCARLLRNIERCVAHGSPELTDYEELYVKGKITAEELEEMQIRQRQQTAMQILSFAEEDPQKQATMCGYLFFKRNRRKCCRRKRWKQRWFEIKDRVLYCYLRGPGGLLCRAISLIGVDVEAVDGRHPHTFIVQSRQYRYQLSASSDEERDQWIQAIQQETARMPEHVPTSALFQIDGSDDATSIDSRSVPSLLEFRARATSFLQRLRRIDEPEDRPRSLTATNLQTAQVARASADDRSSTPSATSSPTHPHKKAKSEMLNRMVDIQGLPLHSRQRYEWFCRERAFVQSLTDTCELLRFLEPNQRPELLNLKLSELEIPPCVYLPLCKSTDPWRKVVCALPKEGRPFNTKARCPCLVLFETLEEPAGRDVATFLAVQFAGHDEHKEERPSSPHSPKRPVSVDLARGSNERDYDVIRRALSEEKEGPRASSPERSRPLSGRDAAGNRIRATTEVPAGDRRSWRKSTPARSSAPEARTQRNSVWRKSNTGLVRVSQELKFSQLLKRFSSSTSSSSRKITQEGSVELPPSILPITLNIASTTSTAIAVPIDRHSSDSQGSNGSTGHQGSAKRRHTEGPISNGHEPPPAASPEKGRKHVRSVTLSGTVEIDSSTFEQLKKSPTYGEGWQQKLERLKASSVMGQERGWQLDGLIAKSNDDLRQEVFVMQLISFYQKAFQAAEVPVWLHTYRILSTSRSTGLIELIKDAISLDGLKKKPIWPGTLRAYFIQTYGDENSAEFKQAQKNFLRSLAGYSVVCYLLAIKDRHNGNVMLDAEGHIVHIDFGFVLGIAPGGSFSLETAPFKLTLELLDVLGGLGSPQYEEFVCLVTEALKVARANADTVSMLIQIMSFRSNYPCFHNNNGATALAQFRDRLMLHIPDDQLLATVRVLSNRSANHSGTWTYDRFQLMSNGIAM